MKTARIFQIAAVVLVIAAVYFLWNGYADGVFASAVLAAAAFFLSIRFQMKERNDIRAAEKERKAVEEDDVE